MKVYPGYKGSGYDWTGEIPAHWRMVQLKFAAPRKTDQTENVKEFGFQIALENIESKTGKLIGNGSFEGLGNIFRRGDVLFNKLRPYLCKVVVAPQDGVAVSELLVLRPREDLDKRYLFYRLLETKFISVVDGSTYGAKMPRANWDFIGNLKIPVPPLSEQQAIADFLDYKTAQIDRLVEKKQKQIDLLYEHRTGLINRAVTKGLNPEAPMKDSGVEWLGEIPSHWEVVSLGKVIKLQRGVDITKNEQEDGSVPVVSSGGIASYHNKAIVKGPGVVVGRKGSVGKLHYIEQDYWPHDTTLYVEDFKGNSPRFVYYKLLTMNLARFDTGSSNPTLNRNIVHPEKVSWTSYKEQIKIVDWLDNKIAKIDLWIEHIHRVIGQLIEYRTALLSEAVTGKIDVR